jgi:hypothetical protein
MASSLTRTGDGRDGGMSDPASLADVSRGLTRAQAGDQPSEVADEPTLRRLALWLADVSVEAATPAAAGANAAGHTVPSERFGEVRK